MVTLTTMLASLLLGAGAPGQASSRAQRLELRDVMGGPRITFPPNHARPVCLIFVLAECPIANKFAPEIHRLSARFRQKVSFYLVHADTSTTPVSARRHAQAFGHLFPVVLDTNLDLARSLGVRHSPEAVVWAGGRVAYQGRINDLYARLGVRRQRATVHDLIDALSAILAGRAVKRPRTPVVGCLIPGL